MILTAEERLEIHDLYARYCHAVDNSDGAAWAACFTRDGKLVPSVGSAVGREIQGRNALAAYGAGAMKDMAARHWISGLVIEERDGRVRGSCYALLLDVSGESARMTAHVVYDDVLAHEDGEWLFATRRPRRDV